MNRCGECNVCCDIPEIKGLNKPAWTLCKHYCNGCTIQETKPIDCSSYQCLYYNQDIKNNKYRPDKLGVLFEKRFGDDFWTGMELVPGAANTEECAAMVSALNRDGSVCVLELNNGMKQYSLPEGMTREQFDAMIAKSRENKQWQAITLQT